MIDFCLQDCLYQDKRARLFYTENGKEIGARAAFARGALVGIGHVVLRHGDDFGKALVLHGNLRDDG